MAPTSQAGGDVSSTVDEDEVAMWIRLLQVQMNVDADRVAETQANEETLIKEATSSKVSVAMRNEIVSKGMTSMKDSIARFQSMDFEMSNAYISLLEGQEVLSSPRMNIILSYLHVCDRRREWESRFLKLFWRHSNGISDDDLLLLLSKLVEHYLPSHEVENLEEFMLTNEERAKFLNDCSTFDKATRLAKDFNKFSLAQGQKPKYWTQRDHTLHSVSSFSESVKPLEVIFPFSTRFETAKKCLDRLDLLKSVTVNLNPDESDTLSLASVLGTFKSPELQALHALKKEMELHGEVALQLEQLSRKHLLAYEELSKDHLERPDEFFRTCQEEKRNVIQEALYKKVKCLASIKKASVCRQEDILKGILQKAESAFKEMEGKLKKAQSSENLDNKECTLCSSKFSKKRKRACLDPCGHASACIDCATKAWTKKPCCPWCKASIRKPISIPAQIFL